MSVVIAMKNDKEVILGADSIFLSGSYIGNFLEEKIGVLNGSKKIIYGLTGSAVLVNILDHVTLFDTKTMDLINKGKLEVTTSLLFKEFIPRFKNAIDFYDKQPSSSIFIAYGNRVWYFMVPALGLFEVAGSYEAIGAGKPYAIGNLTRYSGLFTKQKMKKIILESLKATDRTIMTKKPNIWISTKDCKIHTFDNDEK